MFHKHLKLIIEREPSKLNVFLWQPLVVLAVLMLIVMLRVLGLLVLCYLFFLVFPVLFVSYVYINFIKTPNHILIEIKRDCLIISEPENPFSKNRNVFIDGIKRISVNPIGDFLQIDVQNQSYRLIHMKSFWFGDVKVENLQELLFYLSNENPKIQIDDRLNEI